MKFKEGDLVEVLRRVGQPCGSWFTGNIISVGRNHYIVGYESLSDQNGKMVKEKVHKEDVRPRPPLRKTKRWKVGDVAEVFDVKCWRVGKIAKLLKKKKFVIRLFGSIQLQEFHESKLRIRQAWSENKWSVINQVARTNEFTKSFSNNSPLKGRTKNNIKTRHPAKVINRSHAYHVERSFSDMLSFVGKCHRSPRMRHLTSFKQFDEVSCQKLIVDEKLNKESGQMNVDMVRGTTAWLDSNQCSVGSCSSNDFVESPSHNCRKPFESQSFSSEAESSCPSWPFKKHLTQHFDHQLEANIHELEFHAYKTTMQALYASGPLSWEQESLLTNLRLSLHISDEEHLLHLRHLLSTQVS